jgi:hypothetical protein
MSFFGIFTTIITLFHTHMWRREIINEERKVKNLKERNEYLAVLNYD